MNKKTAYSLGVDSGLESAIYGQFSQEALCDLDAFLQEASDILENKRQMSDSPTYAFAREENSESLFDAFDNGESVGLNKGWRKLAPERKKAESQIALSEALSAHSRKEYDYLLAVGNLAEIPADYRGEVLLINDHGNATLYIKSARKLKEIASRV